MIVCRVVYNNRQMAHDNAEIEDNLVRFMNWQNPCNCNRRLPGPASTERRRRLLRPGNAEGNRAQFQSAINF